MNLLIVTRVVAAITIVVGLAMLTAAPVAMLMGDSHEVTMGLLRAAIIPVVVGGGTMFLLPRKGRTEVRFREGFGIVTFSWVSAAVFGSLPFLFAADFTVVDALFETMSGFTTTGASILSEIESLPKGVLYWRSLTHWLGGMGIVVLSLAILPILGIGGMQLYKAEAPGPTTDQLAPRIASTAKLLWLVYLGLSLAETILLALSPKMDLFEAWCHTAGTLATGGFSTKNNSVKGFDSAYIDWVITIFMFAAGTNFALHVRWISGRPLAVWKDEEFRTYCKIVLFAIVTIGFTLYVHQIYDSFADIARHSSFIVVSIMTTTGFGTEDYDKWPFYARGLLIVLMFVGGCGGSTSGGMKVSRWLLMVKYSIAQLKRSYYPRMVTNVQLHGQRVPDGIMDRILTFTLIYVAVFVVTALAICLVEPNLHALQTDKSVTDTTVFGGIETAFSAAVATLSNIGPGLGQVGPTMNYGWMAPQTKMILWLAMLIGRLEVYTVLVLFMPSFWRK